MHSSCINSFKLAVVRVWKALLGAGGVTGGFAGGEAGLQQFLTEGEVKFRDPNDQGAPGTLATL